MQSYNSVLQPNTLLVNSRGTIIDISQTLDEPLEFLWSHRGSFIGDLMSPCLSFVHKCIFSKLQTGDEFQKKELLRIAQQRHIVTSVPLDHGKVYVSFSIRVVTQKYTPSKFLVSISEHNVPPNKLGIFVSSNQTCLPRQLSIAANNIKHIYATYLQVELLAPLSAQTSPSVFLKKQRSFQESVRKEASQCFAPLVHTHNLKTESVTFLLSGENLVGNLSCFMATMLAQRISANVHSDRILITGYHCSSHAYLRNSELTFSEEPSLTLDVSGNVAQSLFLVCADFISSLKHSLELLPPSIGGSWSAALEMSRPAACVQHRTMYTIALPANLTDIISTVQRQREGDQIMDSETCFPN